MATVPNFINAALW